MLGSRECIGKCTVGEGDACARVCSHIPYSAHCHQISGTKYVVEVAVGPCLIHPLILGTNCSGFQALAKEMFPDGSFSTRKRCRMCAALAEEAVPCWCQLHIRETARAGGDSPLPSWQGFPSGILPWSSQTMRPLSMPSTKCE